MTLQPDQSCFTAVDDPFRCPTKWELWTQIVALLPMGRAWQSNEAVARIPSTAQIEVARSSGPMGSAPISVSGVSAGLGIGIFPAPVDPNDPGLSVLHQYWAAYAEVLEYLHQRACALIDEMFCSTMDATADEWGTDYGYPDTCAPWNTLCDKVRAVGGSSCAYLASLAAQVGYVIECVDCPPIFGPPADCAVADYTPLCQCEPNVITIRIPANQVPGLIAPATFAADMAVADCTPPCAVPPDIVVCLIERFKPAHVKAIYEVIP